MAPTAPASRYSRAADVVEERMVALILVKLSVRTPTNVASRLRDDWKKDNKMQKDIRLRNKSVSITSMKHDHN